MMPPGEDEDHRIAAIVVSWNTRELLRVCLTALTSGEGSCRPWILCIDNASSDGSADMIDQEFPDVELLRNAENVGFAPAVNQGLALALRRPDVRFVALINSDAIVAPMALAALVRALEADPAAGAIGPAVRHPDGRLQKGALGFAPGVWSAICHFLFLSSLSRGRLHGVFVDQKYFARCTEPVSVDWVTGACLVARCDVIRRVGMLDEGFFMYAEDVEWGCRMQRAGFSVLYAPFVEVVHHQGASSSSTNPRWLASLCELVRREQGTVAYVLFRAVAGAGLLVRCALYGLLSVGDRDGSYRRRARNMAVCARWALTEL